MLSVVIATNESEQALMHTLAPLVAGALAGVVREVIVADAGSKDATADVADVAGCHFVVTPGSLGTRLAKGAAIARAPWLMFLQPGCIPDTTWVDEVEAFVRANAPGSDSPAAVFRRRPGGRSTLAEALALLASAFGAAPKPSQGLVIAKSLYQSIGGHNADAADTESDLLRRLGRRRTMVLTCGMAPPR
jgi:hypothetical protein